MFVSSQRICFLMNFALVFRPRRHIHQSPAHRLSLLLRTDVRAVVDVYSGRKLKSAVDVCTYSLPAIRLRLPNSLLVVWPCISHGWWLEEAEETLESCFDEGPGVSHLSIVHQIDRLIDQYIY